MVGWANPWGADLTHSTQIKKPSLLMNSGWWVSPWGTDPTMPKIKAQGMVTGVWWVGCLLQAPRNQFIFINKFLLGKKEEARFDHPTSSLLNRSSTNSANGFIEKTASDFLLKSSLSVHPGEEGSACSSRQNFAGGAKFHFARI